MLGSNQTTDIREIAARALCEHDGQAADFILDGKPIWMSYLEEVDVVLKAIGWAEEPIEDEAAFSLS